MIEIRESRASDGQSLVSIWRSAVDATHDFLDPLDREEIDAQVQAFLPASSVWLAVNDMDEGIGFMGLTDGNVDSLFIDGANRGLGVGRRLIEFALTTGAELTTQCNEQNGQAVGFYRHLGFVTERRTPLDEYGRAYPLLHMRLAAGRYAFKSEAVAAS